MYITTPWPRWHICFLLITLNEVLANQMPDPLPWVDTSFSCPLIVDCPPVCVKDAAQCPDIVSCAPGITLCPDGRCVDLEAGEVCSNRQNPCGDNKCEHTVACAVGLLREDHQTCEALLGELYEEAILCTLDDPGCPECSRHWNDPLFLWVYIWLGSVAGLSLLWCAFNQRLCPRGQPALLLEEEAKDTQTTDTHANPRDTDKLDEVFLVQTEQPRKASRGLSPIQPSLHSRGADGFLEVKKRQKDGYGAITDETDENIGPLCTQTGYRKSYLGSLLYFSVMSTLLGLQVLLILLCISYYALENDILGGEFLLGDETQALFVFQCTWTLLAVWWVLMKWPTSVHSLFLRRCPLSEADYVAVFTEQTESAVLTKDNENELLGKTKAVLKSLHAGLDWFCRVLFSDRSRPPGLLGDVEFCQVMVANSDGDPRSEPQSDCLSLATLQGERNAIPKVEDQSEGESRREFHFHLCQYVFDTRSGVFGAGRVSAGRTIGELRAANAGLSRRQVQDRLALVGPNEVRTRKPSYLTSLAEEFGKLFYVYQNLMAWTWFNFVYWHMGIVYTMVYLLGGFSVALVNYRNEVALSSLSKVEGSAMVLRDGEWQEIDQREVVPGDVLHLGTGVAQCDLVLLTSPAVVDESSLTGESMPVVKIPLDASPSPNPAEEYNATQHKKHTIFAGTTVLQIAGGNNNDRSLAIVTRTGAQTSKGELLRNILFSRPPKFQFDLEIEVVMCILLACAVVGFCLTLSFLGAEPVAGWFYAMYVVGTCLPPLLPTVFVVSVGISSQRLGSKRVICSDPKRLLMAGKVRVAAFDKTGTLTKQGLEFLATRSCKDGVFSSDLPLPPPRSEDAPGLALEADTSLIARAMAVCHTLSKVQGPTEEDSYVGNSVDVQMFKASGYRLSLGLQGNPDRAIFSGYKHAWANQQPVQLAIVQRFDFDHKLMTQCSVVKDESEIGLERGKFFVYAKGSAEAIKMRCEASSLPAKYDHASSLPAKYDHVAEGYSRQGLYCIAVARRELSSAEEKVITEEQKRHKLERAELETKLSFFGFLLFKNALKPDTADALAELRRGDVRTLIVSGDHVLTAVHVGKESALVPPGHPVLLGKILPRTDSMGEVVVWESEAGQRVDLPPPHDERWLGLELAVTGKVYRALEESGALDHLLQHIRIYGRMTPVDKVSVVQHYVNRGWITLFCGDGGNDCGALRTAHVGVALSNAEASVVSPFTALDKSCQSVIQVLLEGRCALSAAFSSYKYMLMYGQ
eukprot:g65228.t1